MLSRFLESLEYPQYSSFNIEDRNKFQKLIIWLEKNRIKKSNCLLESSLNSEEWDAEFDKYLKSLNCPEFNTKIEKLHWILGFAIQIETESNIETYKKHTVGERSLKTFPNISTDNPLDNLDFTSKEFSDGMSTLSEILKIAPCPKPTITLKAISDFVCTRLSQEAFQKPNNFMIKGTPFPIQNLNSGFDLKDPVLNNAVKVLKLLYIHDLRSLQTHANELIVAAQNITANPKTDTKLGQTGV